MNMKVDLCGVTLNNPVMTASGTFGAGEEYSEFVDLNRLGAVVTKGVANVPWEGNPTPRVAENPFSKQYAVDAGKRAIGEHLKRLGVDAVVTPTKDMGFYEVEYPLTEQPLVSIIIPSKDEVETLRKCIAAIEKSSYGNYEVIVVENNSCEDTFRYYGDIAPQETTVDGTRCMEGKLAGGQRICVAVYMEGFNYSKLNNFGVKFAKGSYYLLMNNDIEMIGNDWMKRMLGSCLREEVGIVGAKLFYPDHTIQHAGIVVGIGGSARGIGDNMFVGLAGDRSGYMHKASLQLDYSAVTAACLMVKREIYEQAGVSEYWIVSPREHAVEIYYLEEGKYKLVYSYILQEDKDEKDYNADTIITLREFPHIAMTLEEIFDKVD